MDFFANLVTKVGGDDALNMINDQLTPLLLKSFRPKISEYVGTHVERTRGDLFQQLPDGVKNVLDDIIPGGLNPSQQRGMDGMRGLFDELGDQIRQKISEILERTQEHVREIVSKVTSSTSDRVTNSVVDIAQNKLRLKTRAIQDDNQGDNRSRGFDFSSLGSGSGSGDFIDNFINSSLEDVRPLVRGELKSIYDHIVDLVPQDARKILVALVPGLKDSQQGNNNQQGGDNQYNNQFQGNNNQYNNQHQGNNNQYNNQYQGNNNQYNNQQGSFDQYNQQGNFNNQQGNNRGIETEDSEPRSRGFMSDIKNMAHQFKDTVKSELNLSHISGSRGDGAKLLEEFQNKAKDKISRITTELMNQLENKIMVTVSEELRSVAKSKLANNLSM